jgi:transcriptional regulator with XRE-family HTH domain
MPRKSHFGNRLRELRQAAGLSQRGLAQAAGVGVSLVPDYEAGRREPTFSTLVKLACALDVSLAEFDPPQRKRKQEGR